MLNCVPGWFCGSSRLRARRVATRPALSDLRYQLSALGPSGFRVFGRRVLLGPLYCRSVQASSARLWRAISPPHHWFLLWRMRYGPSFRVERSGMALFRLSIVRPPVIRRALLVGLRSCFCLLLLRRRTRRSSERGIAVHGFGVFLRSAAAIPRRSPFAFGEPIGGIWRMIAAARIASAISTSSRFCCLAWWFISQARFHQGMSHGFAEPGGAANDAGASGLQSGVLGGVIADLSR